MAQFCWKIRQLSTTSSKQNVHVVYLLCLLLKNNNKKTNKKTILSLFKTHVFWACLEVSRNLRRKNCRKGKDFYKIHVQHVHCTLNWEILMTASFVLYTVCVYSAHRQVLPYSSRSKVSLLTAAIFYSVQHSHSKSPRWYLSYFSPLSNQHCMFM